MNGPMHEVTTPLARGIAITEDRKSWTGRSEVKYVHFAITVTIYPIVCDTWQFILRHSDENMGILCEQAGAQGGPCNGSKEEVFIACLGLAVAGIAKGDNS